MKTIKTPKPRTRRIESTIFVIFVLLSGVFLFAKLGHYALWDDESFTGLAAEGVLSTGDTSAVLGHNIVALRDGVTLRNLKERSTPPLPAYLDAPFIALLGATSLAARLPFALCGLACILFIGWWLWSDRVDLKTWALTTSGILGNVSLFLYLRQSRYYAPAILFSVLLVYFYTHWTGSRRQIAAFVITSIGLLISQYMMFFAFYGCLVIDFIIWGKSKVKLTLTQFLALAVPQIAAAAITLSIWNPLAVAWGERLKQYSNGLPEKTQIFLWSLRDLNACEFWVGGLMLIAPVIWFYRRDIWLLRSMIASLIFIVITTALSPQLVQTTTVADVRYLVPLIPLAIFMAVRIIIIASSRISWLAIPLGILAFGTDLLHGAFFSQNKEQLKLQKPFLHSTVACYISELANSLGDPYATTAHWINENVKEGESIWVLPDYMAYPLMFHAPKAIYAWQLAANNHDPQYAGLPAIQFQGRIPPDYIIAFGPVVQQIRPLLAGWQGVHYEQSATLDFYWKDLYRPELFWRTFKPISNYNKSLEGIYVFKRQ